MIKQCSAYKSQFDWTFSKKKLLLLDAIQGQMMEVKGLGRITQLSDVRETEKDIWR